MEQKTIFITSFHPLISRNILMSGVLSMLAKERRVVIFVPLTKAAYFTENFSADNIIIEGISTELGKHDLRFRKVMLAHTHTRALYIKKRAELYKNGKFFSFCGSVIPAILFGRLKFYIQVLRVLDYYTAGKGRFEKFFDQYHPDLVFSTDVQNELDVSLMQAAKKRATKTIGMVRSWDNLTSKGILRIIPDRLVVNNEIIKTEAERYSFVAPEKISVIGIPHYDRYVKARARIRDMGDVRNAFFASLHFDPRKKLILFAPFGDRYISDNKTDRGILEILSGFDANVLVRLPPTDTVNFDGFKSRGARVEFYKSGNRSWRGGEKMNELSEADEEHLVQSLSLAHVVVTGQSTIAVDAMVFDRPVITVMFDEEPREYFDSVRRYYDYEYYEKFRKTGGVRSARTPDELTALVRDYLEHPERDKEERRKAAETQTYLLDGKATERLADAVLYTHGS